MDAMLFKTLLVTIAALIGVIVAIVTGLLTRADGGHIAAAIRGGGIGFAATTTFVLVVMTHLGVL
ncbi:hypothetical protein [Nocardia niwae]|uniref:hypothetical protein n=1 Tax=Nocardia niwae TaxID=626084 RepID=UPI0033C68972